MPLVLEELHRVEGALHHGVRVGPGVFLQDPLFEGAYVDPYPYGHAAVPAGDRHLFQLFRVVDRAGVDPDAVDPRVNGLQGDAVVEVDVPYDRYIDLPLQKGDDLAGVFLGQGDPYDLAARPFHVEELVQRLLEVLGVRLEHGLDADGVAAPDLDAADADYPCLSFFHDPVSRF